VKIKVNVLDPKSIDKAIAKVNKEQSRLKGISREILQQLVDDGVEYAKAMCPLDSGETYDSIHGYITEDGKGMIVAGGNAVWVEFGTGVKGAESPYPGEASVMSGATPYNGYMSGEHIIETKDGRIGWFYPVSNGDKTEYRFTEGMPSRPFMWETAHHLRAIAPEVVKVTLGKMMR
jgi:hypothetical protein